MKDYTAKRGQILENFEKGITPEPHQLAMRPDAKMVKIFFDLFNDSIGDLPMCHRQDIFNICVVKQFEFLTRVLTPDSDSNDIYLIMQGKAVQMKQISHYNDF